MARSRRLIWMRLPAEPADLLEGELDDGLPARHLVAHPGLRPARAGGQPVGGGPGGDAADEVADAVERLHRGRRVVDRRREGPFGDVDELAEREADVLVHRARLGQVDGPAEPGQLGRPHLATTTAATDTSNSG